MRDAGSHLFRNEITQNRFVWLALLLCTGLILLTVYVPLLSQVLQVVDPGLQGWELILGMSFIPLLIGQIWKLWQSRTRRNNLKTI
jgi:Ca2+-transporting ATPase